MNNHTFSDFVYYVIKRNSIGGEVKCVARTVNGNVRLPLALDLYFHLFLKVDLQWLQLVLQ